VAIAAFYLGGTFAIRERQNAAELDARADIAPGIKLSHAQLGFIGAAAVIVLAGPQLASSGDALAEDAGLSEAFFGALALALVTSLPELAVSISALRIGAQNLAIASLIGSNATNMALLLPLDIAYRDGPLLEEGGPALLVAAGAAVLLMSIGTMAIVLKAERGRMPVDVAALLVLATYAVGLWAIYDA
jgi:cation:H+ antiporter